MYFLSTMFDTFCLSNDVKRIQIYTEPHQFVATIATGYISFFYFHTGDEKFPM
jgi:hypothetical protein